MDRDQMEQVTTNLKVKGLKVKANDNVKVKTDLMADDKIKAKVTTGYSNPLEFKNVLKETGTDTLTRINRIRRLADGGNVEAALWYAKILMAGQWDKSRMTRDLIAGTLLPATSDPTQDPYLLYQRDQYKAISYLFIAASCDISTEDVNESRGILAYCQTKQNIGYKYSGAQDALHKNFYQDLQQRNGYIDPQHAPFLSWPYSRPVVEDPRTSLIVKLNAAMAKLSRKQLQITMLYSSVFLIVLLFNLHKHELFLIIPSNLFFVILPLYIFDRLYHKYGVIGGMPCCQCAKFREAYQLHVERMLPGRKFEPYPFDTVPFFIRNLTTIKSFYFLFILFSSITAMLFSLKNDYILICLLSLFLGSSISLILERTGWYNEICVKLCENLKEMESDPLQQV